MRIALVLLLAVNVLYFSVEFTRDQDTVLEETAMDIPPGTPEIRLLRPSDKAPSQALERMPDQTLDTAPPAEPQRPPQGVAAVDVPVPGHESRHEPRHEPNPVPNPNPEPVPNPVSRKPRNSTEAGNAGQDPRPSYVQDHVQNQAQGRPQDPPQRQGQEEARNQEPPPMTRPEPAQASHADGAFPACLQFGPIRNSMEHEELKDWFTQRGIQVQERLTQESGRELFMVFAAMPSAEQTASTYQQLRDQGFQDVRVLTSPNADLPHQSHGQIKHGQIKHGISMGVYSSRAAARKRQKQLQSAGFTAQLTPHAGKDPRYWLYARVMNPEVMGKVSAGFPAHYSHVPADCGELDLLAE